MHFNIKQIILVLSLVATKNQVLGSYCEIFPPEGDSFDGSEFGFIFVPGAQIKGEMYGPLSVKIQSMFPGKMWVGLTVGWLGDFPNPLEADGGIRDCFKKAQELGLGTSKVYEAGHSLGGIVLETWARDNADMSAGIILFGSYLADGFGGNGETNVFPVPVLTAMGSLDGGALSYVTREARESHKPELEGKFPVFVIDRVNHGQVASGELPDVVIERDVDAEVDGDEAYKRYAEATVAFMVTNSHEDFTPEIVDGQMNIMRDLQTFTDAFLKPFEDMRALETNEDGTVSLWAIEGQKIISGASDVSLARLDITNELVEFSDLGNKPTIEGDECEALRIKTWGYLSYPLDPLDFGGLLSADMIKAKYKLEDIILEKSCEEIKERNQCADINAKALELALNTADDIARERYLSKGRQLVFGDDYVSGWGPGWEYTFGLSYTQIDEKTVQAVSTSLISEPDFIIGSAAGMHYCDLLSPYRALEWIYITGVQHGKEFKKIN